MAAAGVKLGMPPAKLGLVYSHTGLRRFIDAIGAPRMLSCSCWGATSRPTRHPHLGARLIGVAPEHQLEQEALELLAGEWVGNAPLAQSEQACHRRAARRGLEVDPQLEEELEIELRRASFSSEDMREGVRAFGERRAPRWQGR